jgi:hypothetical protein
LVAICGVPLESFTWMVTANVPATLGVPGICPLEEASDNPVGREPELTDQL